MTTDRKLKIIFGLLSIGLLVTLLVQLTKVPGGMILSGLFLGIMLLVGVIIGCLILTSILKFIFKQNSFLTLFSITTSVSFLLFHFYLYSPTLKIKVPNGYSGQISLVLSNVKDNILTVDSNGIGYIDKWTFDNTSSKPIVEQMDGKIIDKNLVGFNPSTFWAQGNSESSDHFVIEYLSFEIVPDNKLGQKQYYSSDLTELVDRTKLGKK